MKTSHLESKPQYVYEKLNYQENVRMVTLRPADYSATLIDCELRECRLKIQETVHEFKPKPYVRQNSDREKANDKSDKQMKKFQNVPNGRATEVYDNLTEGLRLSRKRKLRSKTNYHSYMSTRLSHGVGDKVTQACGSKPAVKAK